MKYNREDIIYYDGPVHDGSFTRNDRFKIITVVNDGENGFYYKTTWLTKPEGNRALYVQFYDSVWGSLHLVNPQLEFNFDV